MFLFFQLTKGREQLEEARRTYEILNTELHDELPALYDSRILFLVTNLQTLFASEQIFHNEVSKVCFLGCSYGCWVTPFSVMEMSCRINKQDI